MAECDKHPGFIQHPHYGYSRQLTASDAQNDPSLNTIFAESLEQLQLGDFLNECYLHLNEADSASASHLLEAARQLFGQTRMQAYPFNCHDSILTGATAVAAGVVENTYGPLRLVFVTNSSVHHSWAELINTAVLKGDLVESYFQLPRLVIDFTGMSPRDQNETGIKHDNYTPHFGSPELAQPRLAEAYASNSSSLIIVHHLAATGLISCYENGYHKTTFPGHYKTDS